MIGANLQADNRGSEASAVNEVDRPQLVVERAAAALFTVIVSSLVINRAQTRRQKRLKICLAINYSFVIMAGVL